MQRITAAALALTLAATIAGCGGATSSSSRPTAKPSVPAPAATPTLSANQQQFVSGMQSTFSFGSSVAPSDLVLYGQQVCSNREGGASVASEVPFTQQTWSNVSAGDAIQMITLAVRDICPAEAAAQTVTYEVIGSSSANVTYGPDGSTDQGTVPMSVRRPLGSPQFYAINAQLNGGGSVSCKLKVDGVTISSASASGGYNIAACEIDQDATTESWQNTNDG